MTRPAVPDDVMADLAPSGSLRIAINLGNSVLVQTNQDGSYRGIVPALAQALAGRLGVALHTVPYAQAGAVFDSIDTKSWDVCFLAIEPKRADRISFTSPYVSIEGTYLKPVQTNWQSAGDADHPGVRIGAMEGSAYDLFLSRTLKSATMVRTKNVGDLSRLLTDGAIEAIAGVRQPLEALMQQLPDTNVMRSNFMSIEQACGTFPDRKSGLSYLRTFIDEMKRSGFVRETLDRNGQKEVAVASIE